MERLTQRLRTGEVLMAPEYEEKYTTEEWICMLQDRLAAYEDTGVAPEEVTALGKLFDYALKESKTLKEQLALLNHIRELAEADKDGRVVALPCKVGDTVYWLHGLAITKCRVHRIQQNLNGLYIGTKSTVSHGDYRVDLCLGKTIFRTYEEAVHALESMKDG